MWWKKTEQQDFIEEDPAKKNWKLTIDYSWIVQHIPFFVFLSVLAVLYIANGHYAIKNKRAISRLQTNVKELHWEFLDGRNKLMYESKLSEVSKKVAQEGLGLNDNPTILVPGGK